MMRNALAAFALLFTLAQHAPAQKPGRTPRGLPAGAVVVEERPLELAAGRRRSLLLWMLRPKKYPRGPEETYTCPEQTRGSFYRGPARVSLYDPQAGRVVNTLKVTQEYSDGSDEFDLPYRIRAGGYYHVPAAAEGREGRPAIMRLRDLNGDGRALEFALFDALACMGLETALFGYSERQDRVIQYAVRLETEYEGEKTTDELTWVDYLFSREPVAPGRWRYEIDYRGRGGTHDVYDVRYDPAAERFEGTVRRTPER
ncbi:MAG TPA: hypothetical protein VF668_03585 [Pyrinomonadaceae bacterium]|jgi:hypothetical protein